MATPIMTKSGRRTRAIRKTTDERIVELRKALGITSFKALSDADRLFRLRTDMKAVSLGLMSDSDMIVNRFNRK